MVQLLQEAKTMSDNDSPMSKSEQRTFCKEYVNSFQQNEKEAMAFVANQMEQNKGLINQDFILQARQLAIDGRLRAEMRKVNS